ncbi:NODAL protein, partial [Atractosteus spatula]|nr:NODAL protein [Atractosteus spatula]
MYLLKASSVLLCSSLLFSAALDALRSGDHQPTPAATHKYPPAGLHLPASFMRQLYRRVQSDSVKSILPKRFARKGSRWVVTFDLSTFLTNEELQMAELRIRFPRVLNLSTSTVEVRHAHEFPCPNGTCYSRQLVGLFSASSFVASNPNWKIYNITNVLGDWLKENLSSLNRKLEKEPSLPRKDLPPSNSSKDQALNGKALLVVFTKVKPSSGLQDKASLLLAAEHSGFVFSHESQETGNPIKAKRNRRQQDLKAKSLCRRVDLHVDFSHVGWASWIVYPKRYNAYRCEGECPYPLGEQFKPTNHAYMQSLVKLYNPDQVPSTCCVPIKTSPLSMLYFDEDRIVLRHHEGMIVDECGCR